jgi:nucleoside-diphosphate-sugar epimerase
MIIGNGLLAKAFSSIDNDDYIFFCSGVSDSTEVKDENFKREIDLLKEQDKEKKIIYFSSISVCDDKDLKIYTQHKRNVEIQIHNLFLKYLIFRLPQVLGYGGNKKNLINYFKNKIKNEENVFIKNNVVRSVIDIEDVMYIVSEFINEENKVINFSGFEIISVKELVYKIAKILNKQAKIIEVDSEKNFFPQNDTLIEKKIKTIENYTELILNKYIND